MKKFFVLFSSVALLSLVACGPSDAEKQAKREQEIKDSTRVADSLEVIRVEEAAKMEMNVSVTDTGATIDTTTVK